MVFKAKKRIISLWHSLSFKFFLILMLIIILVFGGYAYYSFNLQKKIYEDTIELSIYRASDIIKQSLYRLMLQNEREELYHTIKLIGDEPGIERIRIYNKKGEIKFSTSEDEIGKMVDMRAEACYMCHSADQPIDSLKRQQKTRIYRTPDGYRVMGMINPIRNSPTCSNQPCHAHDPDKKFLGVLDVQMSLNDLDLAVSRTRRTVLNFSVLVLLVLLTFFALLIYLLIYRPIQKLQYGTMRLAVGDLDYRIKMERRDELGLLARSFNKMAENLKQAYLEVKSWSVVLEKRVAEKTEELRRMHRNMLQVEKMASLGKLAASVAHELNNPLAGILTYSKLTARRIQRHWQDGPEKEKVLHDLKLISSESMRCGNIVRNLLAFARGKSTHFQPVVLREIIERALAVVKHHLKLANIEIKKEISLSRPQIIGDFDQLVQVLVALFVNAVEAMPEGGMLTIRAFDDPKRDEWVRIEVEDNGVGIPEEIRDKIFEPFFSTKKEQKGVGLGLAVVYGIIQRHQGRISVESEAGKGSTFIIELPQERKEN